MPIQSRWSTPVPRCSLQQWVFGSSQGDLSKRKAYVDADRPETHFLTFADYRLLAKRVAVGLQSLGIQPGDRVLLFSGNSIFFAPILMGIIMAGGIFTGANPSYVARELAYQLRDSGAKVMLAAEDAFSTALDGAREAGLPPDRVFMLSRDTPGTEAANSERPAPGRAARREDGVRHWTELLAGTLGRARGWDWAEPADPEHTTCCLNYSSGTTGVPKGVEISHHAYVANGTGVVYLDRRKPDFEAWLARAASLCVLPMYHAYGQTYYAANTPHLGITTYVMPRFDFEKMLAHVQRFRISSLTVVPPILVALAKHPAARAYDLSSIETVGSGAAPLSHDIGDAVERLWPSGDVRVKQGWGMTEVTCTCISWDPIRWRTDREPGVGELMPNCAARIMALDDDGGGGAGGVPTREITEPGRPGELWVTGPTLMRGYWGRPDATAEAVVVDAADGTRWLRTGDVAVASLREPGAVFRVVDRIKELIKVKGNQVAPAELEAVLLERPDVVDAAVVGVVVAGEERPRAYVVRAPSSRATERDVAAWMDTRVAPHKRLRAGVAFIESIPKNPSGKILRKFLRERAQKEVGDRKPTASKLA